MNTRKFNWILYLILVTILATISVQLYWNYKNYEQNKQTILNEIQLSLDNSIEQFFANLSKENFLTIVESGHEVDNDTLFSKLFREDSLRKQGALGLQSLVINSSSEGTTIRTKARLTDSLITDLNTELQAHFHDSVPKIKAFTQRLDSNIGVHVDATNNTVRSVKLIKGKTASDSLKLIKGLQTIFIALKQERLDYAALDSLLSKELLQKKITIAYGFDHYKEDTLYKNYGVGNDSSGAYKATSKSTYFNNKERLDIYFSDPNIITLKRSSTGILLSFLLSLAVISSLFYLLKIIKGQKQLAEIKNDLISNITHEFKTPIATVSTAIEALESFNENEDKEKAKKYLNISSLQLKKLHQMVEKLLETAMLDSENLLLNKERTDLISLIEKLVQKHRMTATAKQIKFSSNVNELRIKVDRFHIENAVSNLIDNAIKYGGDLIEITITSVLKNVEIAVADNGDGIDKNQLDKIFDQFYRVPKGNIHDVKGFGIGLYYAKKIIEKHGGSISVVSHNKNTLFKIILPHE